MRILTLLFKANRLWYEAAFTKADLRNIQNLVNMRVKIPHSTLIYHASLKKVFGPSLDDIAKKFNVKMLTYGDTSKYTRDAKALDGLAIGVDDPTDLRFHVEDAAAEYREPSGIFNLSELEAAWQTSPIRRPARG